GGNGALAFVCGGEMTVRKGDEGNRSVEFVEFGRRIEGTPGTVKDGKVRLDLRLSNTTVGERSEDRVEFYTESTRTLLTVRLGEVVKLRWGKGTADRQVWAELSVHEIEIRP